MTTLQLGSVVFQSFATSGWVFSDLIGWRGLTDNKVPNNERPQGHGSFEVQQALRTSRPISFEAVYLGESDDDVQEAIDSLAMIGAEGPVLMVVDGSWRSVTVENIDAPDNHEGPEGVVKVDCLARNPRRYVGSPFVRTGLPVISAGRVWPAVWPLIWPGSSADGRITLTNGGKAPSSPMMRLLGGFDTAVITNVETGARIGFAAPVGVSEFVDIDYASRRALLGGTQDVSRWLRYREWEDIAPGSSRTFQFDATNPSGTPYMDGKVDSAWW